ncbi:MAG: flagellar assembly protein FliW [Candidatus Latescibacterota bacterium]|jgi:flagellar assembly factor FliW
MSEAEVQTITIHNVKFGEVTIDRQDLLEFPHGLPGFERFKGFGLVEFEEEAPFLRILSLDEPSLSFVLLNPMLVWHDYDPGIGKDALEGLGIERAEQLAVYCIITLSDDPKKVTANLKGPICINSESMKAKQMILVDDRYHTKHSILASQED